MAEGILEKMRDFEIDPLKSDAEVALQFTERVGEFLEIPRGEREMEISKLLNEISAQRPEFSLLLWRAAAALSEVFKHFHMVQPLEYLYEPGVKVPDNKELLTLKDMETEAKQVIDFIERVNFILDLSANCRDSMIFLLLNSVIMRNSVLGEKLARMAVTFSDNFFFSLNLKLALMMTGKMQMALETHNPPATLINKGDVCRDISPPVKKE